MIFPWQSKLWQHLWQVKQANHLPHALLFTGLAGLGKAVFVDYFVRALLCSQVAADGHACEKCHACRLIAGNTHPNVLRIEPEKAEQAIKIDQIREANEFVNHSSLQGEYRIVIINPANALNANAANALLKTLEEPAMGAIIILISNQSARMPATILSRCPKINFIRPTLAQAKCWLKEQLSAPADVDLLLRLTQGAPLAALRFAQDELAVREELYQALLQLSEKQLDPIKLAASMQRVEPLTILDFLLSWVMDVLRLQLNGNNTEDLVNQDYQAALTKLASANVNKNINFMRYLQQLRKYSCEGINLNKQLMLESIFIRWTECY